MPKLAQLALKDQLVRLDLPALTRRSLVLPVRKVHPDLTERAA